MERQYLLLQYPQGHYSFIKGHVETIDESEHHTAIRETEEETGITDLTFIEDFKEQVAYRYRRQGKMSHKQVIYFLAVTKERDVVISHEHQKFIWLPYEKALEKLTFDNDKRLIEKGESIVRQETL
ncbi:diadenosine tetraphosphate hydrolase [Candidatus Peregrinibacteria bacterium HGW-Peregrinibacteria-1]|nr:MAG: diadenosine tetraphosphate hydrolase [Candidatus Peregrinibacteria bacterium HGW-Peregrinibacteria-1]